MYPPASGPCPPFARLVLETRTQSSMLDGHVARQSPQQVFVHGAHRHGDGVGDRFRGGPAVADDAEAVEADERRAAVFGVIDAAAEPPERLPREHVADAASEGRRELV